MKIAYIIYFPLTKMGGAQVFIFNLLSRLAELDQDVTLYMTDSAYRDFVSQVKPCPFKVKSLIYQTYRISIHMPLLMKQLIRHIQKREKYDLWQIIGAYPAGYIMTSLRGIAPLVLRTHGEDIQKNIGMNYGFRINPSVEKIIKMTVNSMDKVIAMTENMYECYRELEVPPEKIVEIPNAINLKRFSFPIDRIGTRKKYNIPQDMTLLITVGRYHIKKGHDLIPSIAEQLRTRYTNFKWLLVGNGLGKLMSEINRRGLTDYFIIKDEIGIPEKFIEQGEIKVPHDDLIRLLKCSDIFVFPTRLEGFPMVLIEAMAAGIPVVSTNSPGVREVVVHDKTALLSEIDDIDSMVLNIIRLIKNRDLSNNLVQHGKEELIKYDVNKVAGQYLDLYTNLVGRRERKG